MKNKAILMLSGGIDSSIALASVRQKFAIKAIMFDYGQNQSASEIASARRIAHSYDVGLEVIDISGLRRALLGLTEGSTVGVGFYGYRPNCPHALFGLASTYTLLSGARTLIVGVHKEDFKNSQSVKRYLKNYGKEIAEIQNVEFSLFCPFIDMSKPDIIKLGSKLKVPFGETRSCTSPFSLHCGECQECIERKQCFKLAEVKDPTVYQV